MSTLHTDELPSYNYEDYKNWEGRWELIHGIPYAMSPAPSIKHQRISNNIAWQLENLLINCSECQALLPVDWKIDEQTIVQPDNLVMCSETDNNVYLTKAPVIIFEILSKSTASKDRTTKYNLYEGEGVQYYVIVDPVDSIAKIYRLHNGKYIKVQDASDELIDFDLGKCKFQFDFSKLWE